jgi:hypothetical protein
MPIDKNPASPNGEITHGDVREKQDEIIDVVNDGVLFGSMTITNNLTNQIALTGAGNTDFVDNTGFTAITNYQPSETNGFTFEAGTNFLVLPVDGQYFATGYAGLYSSVNNTTCALKFSFNGVFLSPRPVPAKMPNAGDKGLISGDGTFYATAGTVVGVWIASDRNSTVTVPNSSVTIKLLKGFTR